MYTLEIRRAFCNYRFWIAALVGVVFAAAHFVAADGWTYYQMISGAGADMLKMEYPGSVFNVWLGSSLSMMSTAMVFVMPVLAVVPYGATLAWDKKNGYINQIVTRAGVRKYLRAKYAAAFLSAGIIGVIPYAASLLITHIFIPSVKPYMAVGGYAIIEGNPFAGLFYTHPYVCAALEMAVIFLFWGLVSVLSLLVTYADSSMLIILVFPFIVLFLLHTACTGIGVPECSPIHYMNITYFERDTFPAFSVQVLVLVVLGLIFMSGVLEAELWKKEKRKS